MRPGTPSNIVEIVMNESIKVACNITLPDKGFQDRQASDEAYGVQLSSDAVRLAGLYALPGADIV